MINALGTNPSAMVTRIAQNQGASLATQLAKVAQLRMEMLLNQAENQAQARAHEVPLVTPINGAEVEKLV